MSTKLFTLTSTKSIVFFVSTLALLASWLLLFAWIVLTTESFLAPWDLSANRMPIGTWQRTLNDFFESFPGSIVPATITTLASICIFIYRNLRVTNRHVLPISFAFTNIVCIAISIFLTFFAIRIPSLWLPLRYRLDEGYERSWITIVVIATLLLILLFVQVKDYIHKRVVNILMQDSFTSSLLSQGSDS
jgi:hypothetical protein